MRGNVLVDRMVDDLVCVTTDAAEIFETARVVGVDLKVLQKPTGSFCPGFLAKPGIVGQQKELDVGVGAGKEQESRRLAAAGHCFDLDVGARGELEQDALL